MTVSRWDVLAGTGEVLALAQKVDWTATSVGSPEDWPDPLRTTVDLCLSSTLPIMVCLGPDLVQVYNDAYARQLGTRHPTALGQRGRECWQDVWDVLGPRYQRVLEKGEPCFEEDLVLLADRRGFVEESHFTLAIGPVRGAAGEVAGAWVVSTDTTERVRERRRARAVARLAAPLAAATGTEAVCRTAAEALVQTPEDVPFALLYLVDGQGVVARLAGAAGLRAGGRPPPERVHLTSSSSGDPWRISTLGPEGHVVSLEEPGRARPDLEAGPWGLVPREALVLPLVPAGQERPSAVLVAGLAPTCPLDDAYRGFLRRAADEVASALVATQRREELGRRVETLIEAVEARSRFMAGVSHELRTPLNAIIGHVDLLREGIVGPLTDRQAQHVARVRGAAVHLKGLIEEILAFSRFEVGAEDLNVAETDVGQLAGELAELLDPLIEQRKLRFDVRITQNLRPIRTDPVKLRQILMNLLSNAQKYTDAGRVELLVEQEEDGTVRAAVTDTGPGIDQDDQAHIFEPFWRMPGTGERGGTGLGLTLARSLARMLGGDLDVRSSRGAGSTFTVRVPDLGERHEDRPGTHLST